VKSFSFFPWNDLEYCRTPCPGCCLTGSRDISTCRFYGAVIIRKTDILLKSDVLSGSTTPISFVLIFTFTTGETRKTQLLSTLSYLKSFLISRLLNHRLLENLLFVDTKGDVRIVILWNRMLYLTS
jgi:hypothetical protein